MDPHCTAVELPHLFTVSKRSQKYLKIAKAHSFIYFLAISIKAQIFPFLGYIFIRCIKKKANTM